MKNLEYNKMAYLYDKFYVNKNYIKEVEFIKAFIHNSDCKILDAGCGTGNHSKILSDSGYNVAGFDLSIDMVKIANTKIPNKFFVDDLLTISSEDKYDVIISFFAVFNHLKNYKEFRKALRNLKQLLNNNGTIIIDMHNPKKSGNKAEKIDNATRIMSWKVCGLLKKEYTKITYIVGDKKYITRHKFTIFDTNRLEKIARDLGFEKVSFCENYNVNKKANKNSKNIQMVVTI